MTLVDAERLREPAGRHPGRRFLRHEPVEELIDAFTAYASGVLGLGATTVANHRSALRAVGAWSRQRGLGLTRLTARDIEAWLVDRAAEGAKPRTRESGLYTLRAFYRWLDPDGHNPAEEVPYPRHPPAEVVPYRPEQAAAILATAQGDTSLTGRFDHAVLATLRWTGIRVGELAHLTFDRLDLDARRMRVTGKRDKPRLVPVPRQPLSVEAGQSLPGAVTSSPLTSAASASRWS